jgi:HEPN domain-containing protein
MSGDEAQDLIQWREALRWLAKAAEDVAAVRILAREGVTALAALHVQQAVEKILRALLVAAREDVRRTHDGAAGRARRRDRFPPRWFCGSR